MPESTTTAQPTAWEWARSLVLSANLAWTTICLGGFLPGTRVAMIVMTALLVALHFCDPAAGRRAHPAGWLFIPFLAYGVWNIEEVSPVRWIGWTDWLGWAQATAVFWVVLNGIRSEACRRLVCTVIVALAVISVGMALYQHFVNPKWLMLGRTQLSQYAGRATGSFGIPNSQGVLMALLIPPVAFSVFNRETSLIRRVAATAALAALLCGFVLAVSRGAWLALAAALAIRSLFAPGRSVAFRILGAFASVAVPAAAIALLYYTFPIMHERVDAFVKDAGENSRPIIWRGAWGIFAQHPIVGGGAGCFDYLFEAFRPTGFHDEPVYAHCDYLNTLCDYGLIGFVLLFGAAAFAAWKCRGARGIDAAVFTGLLAFSLHLLVDFHMKIPALAMIVASLAAFITGKSWRYTAAAKRMPLARITAVGVSAAALALAIGWAAPKFRAEEIRRAAREKIDKMAEAGTDVSHEGAALAAIRASFDRAVSMDPRNAQAWSDRAYGDSLWALVEPSQTGALGIVAERDASVAIGLSPIVAEFWVRKGSGLDMQGKWLQGGEYSAHALQLAPGRADIWYYQAYHFSLDPIEKGPALAAADFSLRLDPGFLLAQLLRQRLAQ